MQIYVSYLFFSWQNIENIGQLSTILRKKNMLQIEELLNRGVGQGKGIRVTNNIKFDF